MTPLVYSAEEACDSIHRALSRLPTFTKPSEVPFSSGLYFFYKSGETTPHVADGRIVRVGNHPGVDGRLVGRLRDHYRSGRGAKNGSVFRRLLGGALIRLDDPASDCLAPAPGHGHWERQKAACCEVCAPYETRVTELLQAQFTFRCVPIPDKQVRNRLERSLIATIAACQECQPSPAWLGSFAYMPNVRTSGLWNSQGVGGPTMTEDGLESFLALVRQYPRP